MASPQTAGCGNFNFRRASALQAGLPSRQRVNWRHWCWKSLKTFSENHPRFLHVASLPQQKSRTINALHTHLHRISRMCAYIRECMGLNRNVCNIVSVVFLLQLSLATSFQYHEVKIVFHQSLHRLGQRNQATGGYLWPETGLLLSEEWAWQSRCRLQPRQLTLSRCFISLQTVKLR